MGEISDSPYMLIHDLEGRAAGTADSEWPLHFTVVPFFNHEGLDELDVVNTLKQATADVEPFQLHLGREDLYGPDLDIPVTKLDDSDGALMRLHAGILEGLKTSGCEILDMTYAGTAYSPHITQKAGLELPDADYTCRTVSLIQKLPKSHVLNKLIIATIEFDD